MNVKSNAVGRVGRWSAEHPFLTILAWVILAVGTIIVGGRTDAFQPETYFSTEPESQQVQRLEKEHFGTNELATETLIIRSDTYVVTDPEFQAVVDKTIANLAPMQDEIVQIVRFYDAPQQAEMQKLVSADQHALLVPISFSGTWSSYQQSWPTWEGILNASETDGFFVGSVGDIGGSEISQIISEDMSQEIKIGLPVALLVMIVVFGAFVAAGLPLILGVITIMVATGIVQIVSGSFYISDISFTMVSMIGLAVGIDYSLFLLERFREERRAGFDKLDAIEHACATAGKAVLFSGVTTVFALIGVFLVPLSEFQGMGVAMSVAVAIAVLGALTTLPALVSMIGDKVNWPRFGKSGVRSSNELGHWGQVARRVVKHPALSAGVVATVLLLATIPVFTMKLGMPSMASLPESRLVDSYTVLARDFSAGMDDPIIVALTGDAAKNGDVDRVQDYLASTGQFGPSTVRTSESTDLVFVSAPMKVDVNSSAGQDTVASLRSDLLPESGNDVKVGGAPAFNFDFSQSLKDNLPRVFGFVLAFSFLVMMLAFRSIVLPVVSVVLNLLSVGAAYGAVVLVFQHGFLADTLGFKQGETIVNWLPIILFCILFGLSMDYHVFVLSRIREAWDRTKNVDSAIIDGIDHTGRIITGAAVIMMAVFGTFAFGRMAEMQQMGFGLSLAVFVDVFLIRSILLPATLKLVGERAWWWPNALNWVPRVNVEG